MRFPWTRASDVHAGASVLITGAARGIGRCAATEFAAAGCTMFLTDRDDAALQVAADELRATGATVHARRTDVSDRADVEACARWVFDTAGSLDVLVNNAGIGYSGPLVSTTMETWRRLIDVDLMGPLYHAGAFLPSMLKKGRGTIVNVSSGQAFFRLPTWGAYAAIKAAMGVWSELLSFEVAASGIRVVTVYPFLVDTGFYQDIDAGSTWMSRQSIKLMPWYSMKPGKVGRVLFEAARDGRRVEMVHPANLLGFYSRLIPPVSNLVTSISTRLLAGDSDIPSTGGAA